VLLENVTDRDRSYVGVSEDDFPNETLKEKEDDLDIVEVMLNVEEAENEDEVDHADDKETVVLNVLLSVGLLVSEGETVQDMENAADLEPLLEELCVMDCVGAKLGVCDSDN
jgi:hypothetical protein